MAAQVAAQVAAPVAGPVAGREEAAAQVAWEQDQLQDELWPESTQAVVLTPWQAMGSCVQEASARVVVVVPQGPASWLRLPAAVPPAVVLRLLPRLGQQRHLLSRLERQRLQLRPPAACGVHLRCASGPPAACGVHLAAVWCCGGSRPPTAAQGCCPQTDACRQRRPTKSGQAASGAGCAGRQSCWLACQTRGKEPGAVPARSGRTAPSRSALLWKL